jgi:hypothetical protein
MVKLTEVEDEHFTSEKPTPTQKDSLITSDNEEDDFTDTGMSFFLVCCHLSCRQWTRHFLPPKNYTCPNQTETIPTALG